MCRKTNNQYKRSTFEHEAITQHFSIADDSVKPMDRVIYDPVLVDGSAVLLKNNYADKTVIASANDIIHMIKTLYGEQNS